MSWKNKIPATFGTDDLIFANHPADGERALELLKECYKNGISTNNVVSEVKQFLTLKGATQQHIQDQINSVKEKFKGWLD